MKRNKKGQFIGRGKKEHICKTCGNKFIDYISRNRKFCSNGCKRMSKKTKNKLSKSLKGKESWNKGLTKETDKRVKKTSESKIGKTPHPNSIKAARERHLGLCGKNAPNWKGGLENRKKQNRRSDSKYKAWRIEVYKRDDYKCRIDDKNCSGRIEAHHILSWSEFPELRYKVNNGITLCQAHHPKTRAKEKRLVPTFKELVSVSSK